MKYIKKIFKKWLILKFLRRKQRKLRKNFIIIDDKIDHMNFTSNYYFEKSYYYKSTMITKITGIFVCLVLVNAMHKIPGFPWSKIDQRV